MVDFLLKYIWCFVVLDGIPEGESIEHGGITLENGTFAVVESSTWVEDQEEVLLSDLFVPLFKEYEAVNEGGKITKRRFYLADTESIMSPLFVVADVGSMPKCGYFMVKPRSQWVEEFEAWLRDKHELDDTED